MMNRRGFTLVEMMVAMVVLGIMGIAMIKLLRLQHQASLEQNQGVLQTQNARAGVDMLARELRNAGFDPRQLANAGLVTMGAADIEWTADLNDDGDVLDFGGGEDERVRYFFQADSTAIVREANGVQARVADGVSSVAFGYLKGDGTAAASADEVEQVSIRVLYATPDGVMDGDIQTQVALRNLIYDN